MFHMWKELEFTRAIMSTHFSAKSAARYAARMRSDMASIFSALARKGLWSKVS